MPAWWESGYPGGPMVKVDGFPRPLYPPDAAEYGKTPSVDGLDVEAYKRVISRAGRWPWQPYDQAYSNAFAHGKAGGNVADSGVAGVQRQLHIDATGWVGPATFNGFRSIRIPVGLPHAGEPAMDAYAASLIDEAYRLFGGHEPAPKVGIREAALELAIGELGVAEYPHGSNVNPYGEWYGMNGQPWCAMFTTWAYVLAGQELDLDPSFVRGERYAFVPYLVADARAGRYGLRTTDDPIPGDLVAYDWSLDGEHDHVGLFERWVSGSSLFYAIEGNTSASSNSNGGQVQRRQRDLAGVVFIRSDE
jgi:hypothetical protein